MTINILRLSTLVFLAALILSCEKQADLSPREVPNEAKANGDNPSYEAAFALAEEKRKADEPHFEVFLELTNLQLLERIPGLESVFGNGDFRNGTLQGNIIVKLRLSSGELIRRRANIIHVDRDLKGISRIQFDVYEKLSAEGVEEEISKKWPLFQAIGMKKDDFETQQKRVIAWLHRDHEGRSSKEAILYDGENYKILVYFSRSFDPKLGVGIRYVIHPYRIGETRWEKELKNDN